MPIIDLAGIRVSLECQPSELAGAAAERYAPFLVADDSSSTFVVRFSWRDRSFPREASALSLLSDSIRFSGEHYEIDQPGIRASISFTERRADLALECSDPLAELEYFVRIVLALLVDEAGGLLLHAAGVLAEGQAWLFTGQSGSGKTTVVSLLPELVALGDDLLIVKPVGSEWVAYGTPFWNVDTQTRHGQTANAPIGGIFRLVQAKATYTEPVSMAVASAELLANCPVLNGDPARVAHVLARCRTLAQAVTVRRLYFLKDRSFLPLVIPMRAMP